MGLNIKKRVAMKSLEKLQSQKEKFFQAGVNDNSIYESFVKSFRKLNSDRKKARKYIYVISDDMTRK